MTRLQRSNKTITLDLNRNMQISGSGQSENYFPKTL